MDRVNKHKMFDGLSPSRTKVNYFCLSLESSEGKSEFKENDLALTSLKIPLIRKHSGKMYQMLTK